MKLEHHFYSGLGIATLGSISYVAAVIGTKPESELFHDVFLLSTAEVSFGIAYSLVVCGIGLYRERRGLNTPLQHRNNSQESSLEKMTQEK